MHKYYTPEIDEFHVGFEYEYYNENSKKWVSMKFSMNRIIQRVDLSLKNVDETIDCFIERAEKEKLSIPIKTNFETLDWLKDKKLRVKYLDKEDIESLGFIEDKDCNHVFQCDSCIDDLGIFVLKGDVYPNFIYYLGFDLNGKIGIEYTHDYDNGYLFYGIIKNKLELKRLLNQIR